MTGRRTCRLRKLSYAALTQLSIDLASIKEAFIRFPSDARAAVHGGPAQVSSVACVLSATLWPQRIKLCCHRPSPVQSGQATQQDHHRASVEAKMQPAITIVKLLQIADDRAFVTSYQQLLEQRFQSSTQMQQILLVADVSKDTVMARLSLYKYKFRGAAPGQVRRCPSPTSSTLHVQPT